MHRVFKTQKNETALAPQDTNVQLLYFWPYIPNPTWCSLHSLHKKQDAFILIWMTRKDLWVHPSFSNEWNVSVNTFLSACILEHHHHCTHLCGATVDSDQIRQVRYSHHSELSSFSVLFFHHRQHWGSSQYSYRILSHAKQQNNLDTSCWMVF